MSDITNTAGLPLLRLNRGVWLALGIAGAVFAAFVVSPWLLAAWIVPDFSVLAGGFRIVDEQGRMRPAAICGYNAAHALLGPAVLALASIALGHIAIAAAALWLSHIAIDRALGYWPRDAHGEIRRG
jgi:hypothetical protein